MVMKAPNFRTLDLNLLRVFDQVMAERNLTRAARNLAMTQPAVSNALSRLREAAGRQAGGAQRLRRRADAARPGAVARHRRRAAAAGDRRSRPATSSLPKPVNTFVLAMADATAAELMPGLVEIIERDAPGVSMRVLPLTTRDPRQLLDEGQMDLAVGFFPAVLADLTRAGPAGRPGAVRPPAAVRRRIRVRHARGPSAGAGADDAQALLRRPPPAGELFRAALRLHRPGAGLTGAQAPHRAHREPVLHGRPGGCELGPAHRAAAPLRQASRAWPTSWCCATCRSRCRRCTSIRCGTGARANAATTPGCAWRWERRRKSHSAPRRSLAQLEMTIGR